MCSKIGAPRDAVRAEQAGREESYTILYSENISQLTRLMWKRNQTKIVCARQTVFMK
jgi:hypothetical protein